MKEEPLVSIIIPTYNRKHLLQRAIDSCLSQTYKNIEIIIIDDHSTDGTNDSIKEYMQKDKRIRYCKNKAGKKGANAARNTGIGIARGEFLTFCDSDDYLLENSIEVRVAVFQKNPQIGLVYGDAYCEVRKRRVLWKYDRLDMTDTRRYLLEELSLCQQNTIMVNIKFLKKTGKLDENLHGWTDDALVLQVGMKYPIQHCGEVVAVVVKSKISMTNNKRNLYLGLKKLLYVYKKEILFEVGLKRYILWKIRLLSTWFFAKEMESTNGNRIELYGMLHRWTRSIVLPYFRHYFE